MAWSSAQECSNHQEATGLKKAVQVDWCDALQGLSNCQVGQHPQLGRRALRQTLHQAEDQLAGVEMRAECWVRDHLVGHAMTVVDSVNVRLRIEGDWTSGVAIPVVSNTVSAALYAPRLLLSVVQK